MVPANSRLVHLATGLTLSALAFLAAAPAHAQTTFYSTRSAFLANSAGTTTLGFEGLAPDGGFTNYPVPTGLTLSGVNFSINAAFPNSALFVIGKDYYYPGNSVLSTQNGAAQQGDLLITFSSPVTAIGLDFGDNFIANTATFTLSNGTTFTRPTGSGTNFNFVGLTTTAPITTLDIQEPTNFALNIDNFTFGGPAPVPESSTTVSLGLLLVLGGLVIAARRKKSAPSS